MIAAYQFQRQLLLHLAGVLAPLVQVLLEAGQLPRGDVGEEFKIAQHQGVGDGHDLAEHDSRGFVDPHVVPQGFAHLLHPVQPFQQGQGDHHLGLLAVFPLQVPAHQEVEGLVGAAQLHVGLKGHRIIALDQGIEKLVDADGGLGIVTLMEILPLQHAGHGVAGRQLDQVLGGHLLHPAAVEVDKGFLWVQNLEDLALVSGGVGLDLCFREGQGLTLARGIADETGEIADEEDHLVAQVLEVLELLDEHRVPQVQVRGGGIEPGFDPQGLTGGDSLLQPRLKLLFPDDLLAALLDQSQLFVNRFHARFTPICLIYPL